MAYLGVHFALTAEQERRLTSAENEEAVRDVIRELEEVWDEASLVDTDTAWNALHRCLSDGSLDWEAGEYPLNACILGAESLYEGDNYIVSYKDAETVRDVAEALKAMTKEVLRPKFFALKKTDFPAAYLKEAEFTYTWEQFERLRTFYEMAADAQQVVVFTVDQ